MLYKDKDKEWCSTSMFKLLFPENYITERFGLVQE